VELPIVAVLTGDLVNSEEKSSEVVDQAMAQLEATAHTIAVWQSHADLRFTRFRGDGWQVLLKDPWLALRAALVLLARLRSGGTDLSSRISIGLGKIDSSGTTDLSDANGEAFVLSGRGLDEMARSQRIAFSGSMIGHRDKIIARLMFERASRWTMPQAEAMALYLQPDHPTLAELATELGISPQAVNYRLGGGGANELRTTLRLWEEVIERELAGASHA